jgi:hypothetical protein
MLNIQKKIEYKKIFRVESIDDLRSALIYSFKHCDEIPVIQGQHDYGQPNRIIFDETFLIEVSEYTIRTKFGMFGFSKATHRGNITHELISALQVNIDVEKCGGVCELCVNEIFEK